MRIILAIVAAIFVFYLAALPLYIVTNRLTDSSAPAQAAVGWICVIFGGVAGYIAFRAIMKKTKE
jgi:hypothetical protein